MAFAVVRACVPTRTFSSTVMLLKTRRFWKLRAMPRSTIVCAGRPVMSSPMKRICPPLGASRPVTTLKNVDFPEPFGPISATICSGHHGEIEFLDGGDAAEALDQLAGLEDRRAGRQIEALGNAAQRRRDFAARRQRRLLRMRERRRRAARRNQPLPAIEHHQDENDAEDQLDRLDEIDTLEKADMGEAAERMRPFRQILQEPGLQKLQKQRAEHDARNAAHAAEHDHDQHHDRHREHEHFRRRRLQFCDVEGAGRSSEAGADGEGQQFELHPVDAHGARCDLVFTDRHPGTADARILEPNADENEEHDHRDADIVVRQSTRRRTDGRRGSAGQRR